MISPDAPSSRGYQQVLDARRKAIAAKGARLLLKNEVRASHHIRPKSRSLLWVVVPAMFGMPLVFLAIIIVAPPLRIGLNDEPAPRPTVPLRQTAISLPAPLPAPPMAVIKTLSREAPFQLGASTITPVVTQSSKPTEASIPPIGTSNYMLSQAPAEVVASGAGLPEPITDVFAMTEERIGEVAMPLLPSEAVAPPLPIPPVSEATNLSSPGGEPVAAAAAIAIKPGNSTGGTLSPMREGSMLKMTAGPQPLSHFSLMPNVPSLPSETFRARRSVPVAAIEASLETRCRATIVRLQLEALPNQTDVNFLRRSCTPGR